MSRAIASARVCCSRAWPVGAERELAETVQRLGLAEPVAEITQQRQSPLVAGGGRRAFPGHLLQQTQAGAGHAWPYQSPRTANSARACWWLPTAAPARYLPQWVHRSGIAVGLFEIPDLDVVVDLGDAESRPGGRDGLVVLGPGAHDS